MQKYLDRKKWNKLVKELLEKSENISEAVLQLQWDEFWNTETIWEWWKFRRKRYFKCYWTSHRATPILKVFFKDWKEQVFDCYFTKKEKNENP